MKKINKRTKYLSGLLAIAIASISMFVVLTKAQNKAEMDRKTAGTILDSYAQLIDLSGPKAGQPSAADVRGATLSNPHKVAIIPLDKLKAMTKDTGNTVETIIVPVSTVYYEVHGKNGNVLGLVEVDNKDGKYKAVSLGNRDMADAIVNVKAKNREYQETESMIIKFPAIHLELLSMHTTTGMSFLPLQSIPELGIEMGAALTGKELFNRIKKFADSYNGLPM